MASIKSPVSIEGIVKCARSPCWVSTHQQLLFEPDEWQRAALMDLAENPKVAIKSGQGVGKTGLEAAALLWFLCSTTYCFRRIAYQVPPP